jgi:hypothetical protein
MPSLLDIFHNLMGGTGRVLPAGPSHGITPEQKAYMAGNHYNAQGQPTYEILGDQTPLPTREQWEAAPPAAANQQNLPYATAVGKLPSPRAILPFAQYAGRLTGPHLGIAQNPFSQVPLDGSAVFRGDPLNNPQALGVPRMNPQRTRNPVRRVVDPQKNNFNPANYGQIEGAAAANPQDRAASPTNLVFGPGPQQPRISLR